MNNTSKKIYLVDVSSMFFRAFYAIRPLTSPAGVPVNAVYGFLSMILKLMRDEKPEALVFCYDRPEPSFRKDIDANYKANRAEMPEDLVPQMPLIRRIGPALGISCLEEKGYEADDMIGSVTKKARAQGYEVIIVSGDKDFAQLLEPGVVLYDTMKESRTGPAEAFEKWGIHPEQMIDYLALVGDSSDNVPGVRGIGPKGAQKLLSDFKSLDGIYQNIENIKGATKDKLVNHKAEAYMSQKLVTIVCDVPIKESIEDFHLNPVDKPAITTLMNELNFKNLERSLTQIPNYDRAGGFAEAAAPEAKAPEAKASVETSIETPVEEIESALADVQELSAKDLANEVDLKNPAWVFSMPTGLFLAQKDKLFRLTGEISDWGQAFSNGRLQFAGFDLKSLWHELKVVNPAVAEDLQLAAYLFAPGEGSALGVVVPRFLNEPLVEAITPQEHLRVLLRLDQALKEKLDVDHLKLYRELDLPLAPVLYEIERRGVALDTKALEQQSRELATEIKTIEKSVHELAGGEFNIGSPKQLGVVLFETLKLPPQKKTKTGYSTDSDVLEKLKGLHDIVDQIIKYRELTKLKSTYVDALPQLVDENSRLHTTLDQALTATGRLSSRDPNLQNIPIRTERGSRVRQAFVAGPGCELLSVDYSQIELRILAHYSEDKNLIQAFKEDLDIHAATASEIFQVPLKSVTPDQRRTAKAVNFGIAYGQGAFGLAENLGIPRGEAQEIISRYFQRFAGVGQYIEGTIAQAKKDGYVCTLSGRKRFMHELQSKNPAIRKFGERAAINAPIQGTAADIVKLAMIRVAAEARTPMILQIHDELLFEGSREELETEKAKIVGIMESVFELKVPLKVNASIGKNWQSAH